ncbi:MAG: hypothetical protein QXG97_05595 [Nitrososphaerota archaeon]
MSQEHDSTKTPVMIGDKLLYIETGLSPPVTTRGRKGTWTPMIRGLAAGSSIAPLNRSQACAVYTAARRLGRNPSIRTLTEEELRDFGLSGVGRGQYFRVWV